MAHTFALWFAQFFSSARAVASAPSNPEKPLQIEVERLPDSLWRELAFQQPRRREEDVWPR